MMATADEVAREIVDGAVSVHRALGPGLLESAYQRCFSIELEDRGLDVKLEVPIDIQFRGRLVPSAYRMDMLVQDLVMVENKSVDQILTIHEAQVLTYLRLGPVNLGLLLNWNSPLIKNGIRRFIV